MDSPAPQVGLARRIAIAFSGVVLVLGAVGLALDATGVVPLGPSTWLDEHLPAAILSAVALALVWPVRATVPIKEVAGLMASAVIGLGASYATGLAAYVASSWPTDLAIAAWTVCFVLYYGSRIESQRAGRRPARTLTDSDPGR